MCYLDEVGEPLAALLRPGNVGSNRASHPLPGVVLRLGIVQLLEGPSARDAGACDIGGATHAFVHLCRDGDIRFSVGYVAR